MSLLKAMNCKSQDRECYYKVIIQTSERPTLLEIVTCIAQAHDGMLVIDHLLFILWVEVTKIQCRGLRHKRCLPAGKVSQSETLDLSQFVTVFYSVFTVNG